MHLTWSTRHPLSRVARVALAAALVVVSAAGVRAQQPTGQPLHPPPLSRANLDTTCAACTDFYQYANGGWLAHAKIPASYASYGSFTELADRNQIILHEILDSAAAHIATDTGTTRKIGLFYASCMDSAAAEAQGAKPIEPELRRIAAITSPAELDREIARLQSEGVNVLFGAGSEQDAKHSERVILGAGQAGLGLPDRDYYLATDSSSVKLRDAYRAHIVRTFGLLGESPADAQRDAGQVMSIETALARASMTRVAMRDPKATYHLVSIDSAQHLTPNFSWATWMRTVGAPHVRVIDVGQPHFFSSLSGTLRQVPLADWKAYLRWHLVSFASPSLSSPFVNESFRMTRHLTGAKVLLPRWKRCLQRSDRAIGEGLGALYVARTFSPAAKARALAMVQNLQDVLHEDLDSLSWMSPATRRQAIIKLDAFTKKIGYPDKWRDYSKLDIRPGPFVLDRMAANRFETHRDLNKIGKPVDRTEWGMTPPTVNAYYNPSMNEIVFPAGILQPPFFDPNADNAVNYGGMGAVIGHETTHGFDDEGRQYDAKGNLTDWWTAADAARFKKRATLVTRQFDGYVAVDSLHVNGKLTLGENIADLGGLTIAYKALERSLAGKPRPPLIDGFTPEQRFFLSWAQVWREKIRPQAARRLVIVDPHSPAKWRVNGPLSDMPAFAKAFGCKPHDAMVRPDSLRAQIW